MITKNFRDEDSGTRKAVQYSQPRRQVRRMGLFVAALTSLAGAATTFADGTASGRCVDTSVMSIMFSDDATDQEIADFVSRVPTVAGPRFVTASGAWTYTATDGTVVPGEPITLTYSFIPDGTMIEGYHGEGDSPSNLYATLDANYPGGRSAWQAAFAQVFARYGELTNITYVEVSDDGSPFGLTVPSGSGYPGQLGARGDVRIGMHAIGAGAYAYNFYPIHGGDMVIDSQDIGTFTNQLNDFAAFRNTIAHEHGHGLGLDHVYPRNYTKLMEAGLNTGFDGPQEDDIRGIQTLYGDQFEPNESSAEYGQTGISLRRYTDAGVQVFEYDDLALEGDDSEDWFGIVMQGSVSGLPHLAVRVEPLGTVYQQGPEGGTPETVDALAVRNLDLQVYRRVSFQTGEIQSLSLIDFNEAGEAEYHPPIDFGIGGFFFIRVYSNDGVDALQRYRLIISNSAIEAPVPEPVMVMPVADGDTVNIGNVTVNASGGTNLSVYNQGEGLLELSVEDIAGAAADEFEVTVPNTVAVDGFGLIGIGFTPALEGLRQAVVTLSSNDPAQPTFSFNVQGTGTAVQEAILEVSESGTVIAHDTPHDLGEVIVGQTYDLELELTNLSNAALSVYNSASIEGPDGDDFEIVSGLPLSLAPFASQIVAITYLPSTARDHEATIRFNNNGVESPYRVILTAGAVEEEVLIDCNSNGVADELDVTDSTSEDCNTNGQPDECETLTDTDGDGVADGCDQCPDEDDLLDGDADEVADCLDNCPETANPDQLDSDSNGLGDACETGDGPPAEDDPTACPTEAAPVCGVNGSTYTNACLADEAGVAVAYDGICRVETPPDDEVEDCTDDYEPVCGVDGRTYGNACHATLAEVAIAGDGACTIVMPPGDEDDDGGIGDDEIGGGDNGGNEGDDKGAGAGREAGDPENGAGGGASAGMCGAGGLGMVPVILLGLCGLRMTSGGGRRKSGPVTTAGRSGQSQSIVGEFGGSA
ncbi:MAG: choice-of-anchor D domain-containing protein [bacterium]|nr:choice-of-anchor D domain-containing protein [bacterium]